MTAYKYHFTWKDINGRLSRTSCYLSNSDESFIAGQAHTLLQPLSNAALVRTERVDTYVLPSPPAPVASPYDAADEIKLTWKTVAGVVVRSIVPGPIATILLSDEILDPAGAHVADFLTAAKAYLCDRNGNLVNTLTKAVRGRGKIKHPVTA
jgi:hypothetical protein